MIVSSFEILPDDILYEIFAYLSPVDILQSLFSLTKRLSRIISNEYLWHIHIGDRTMSLSMFNDQCENILKLIGGRIVSLRLTLIDVIVDVTSSNPFNCLQVEGVYLVKVCSKMPLLKICRLPFNHNDSNANQIRNNSLEYQIILSNLLNINHLRTLTIGIHTSHFLECLLLCIPFIESLSFGIEDRDINKNDTHDRILLPTTIDAHRLQYLSRLRINCRNSISFHRIIALLSSVFGQLCHLSLKLEAFTLISDPLIISGDIIQQFCIDRLQPMATYILNLLFYIMDDFEEKKIFNTFLKVPFTHRQRPRVFIQELDDHDFDDLYHGFMVYTLPYNNTILSSYIFSTDLEKSSISSLVPWSLLTNLSINHSDVLTPATFESILRMAYNVDTLELFDDRGILLRPILNNHNLVTLINQQIKSFEIYDVTLTLQNVQRICTLLSSRFCNLKKLLFTISDAYDEWEWKPSCIIDGKNKSTKRIVNLIYLLVDQLQKLVYLRISFCTTNFSDTPCFPHLIRQQLHQYPLSRPFRLRVSSNAVEIWL
ncbi:unnamed protein product [Rotaria sordida]|uniref:F-box domain-containing protein n=1 Tax=Rotaria sordida TaxID=392033 RepID=A0A815JJ80_9BILA|nr:unnamed protein product [Rotaria sordida]CAF1615889.1 unnamed protein product [Rotaria sordida]